MNQSHNAYIAWGDAIVRRLDALKEPGSVLAKWRETFRTTHVALVTRNRAVDAASSTRHAHGSETAVAGANVEAALDRLLDLLPAAGLGSRRNPLGNLSTLTPAELRQLGNARLATEIATIVAAIRKKADKSDASLEAAVTSLATYGTDLGTVVHGGGAVADTYHEAVHLRDEQLVDWKATLKKLRRRVATHFEDTPTRAREIFAAPEAGEADVSGANVGRAVKADKKALKKATRAAGEAAAAASRDAAKAKRRADRAAKKAAQAAAEAAAKSAKAAAKVAAKQVKARKK